MGGFCPQCGDGQRWCDASSKCYMMIGGECDDADNKNANNAQNYQVPSALQETRIDGDSDGCLASAGYSWCNSRQECIQNKNIYNCPICLNDGRWCESTQQCYQPIGGQCDDGKRRLLTRLSQI